MAYPAQHLYLSLHWTDSREPNESGQVGIRFDSPATNVTQGMVDACKTACTTFWQSGGALIPSSYQLAFLRLALLGQDGKYVPGTFSFDAVYATKVGTANATVYFPLSTALASTFVTDLPRGPGSHGRIYLPPIAASLSSDGRWTKAQVDARSAAVATLLTSLNAALVASPGGLPAIASVFSSKGAGLRSFVTGVKTGQRPDVQRRRAKSQAEIYGATSAVSH